MSDDYQGDDDAPARIDTGYRPKAKAVEVVDNRCRKCGTATTMLLHDPDQPGDARRTVCGDCQGKANRRILGHVNPVSAEARQEPARRGPRGGS